MLCRIVSASRFVAPDSSNDSPAGIPIEKLRSSSTTTKSSIGIPLCSRYSQRGLHRDAVEMAAPSPVADSAFAYTATISSLGWVGGLFQFSTLRRCRHLTNSSLLKSLTALKIAKGKFPVRMESAGTFSMGPGPPTTAKSEKSKVLRGFMEEFPYPTEQGSSKIRTGKYFAEQEI